MFCTKCGADIANGSKFCTSCGEKTTAQTTRKKRKEKRKVWTRRKSLLLILISIVLTSVFWVFIYLSLMFATEDESVNIMTHLLETVGRQNVAWEKEEQIIEQISHGFSEECLYSPSCIDEVADSIAALRAEIEKEREEIDNLWSKEVLGQDLESYLSKLDQKNLTRIIDVLNIYFPEESEEFEPSAKFL